MRKFLKNLAVCLSAVTFVLAGCAQSGETGNSSESKAPAEPTAVKKETFIRQKCSDR